MPHICKCFRTVIFILPILFAGAPVSSQTRCGQRSILVEYLFERFGEVPHAIGLASDNSLMEVFASEATGTWSVLMTRPGGPSCLVSAGSAYQSIIASPKKQGTPS